jgi:hypothetical protein
MFPALVQSSMSVFINTVSQFRDLRVPLYTAMFAYTHVSHPEAGATVQPLYCFAVPIRFCALDGREMKMKMWKEDLAY